VDAGDEVAPHGIGIDLTQSGMYDYVTLSCIAIDEVGN
jgi:hypothetical protein